jgi:transposase
MPRSLADTEQLLADKERALTTLQGQVTVLEEALQAAQATITKLQHQMEQYLKRLYGPRSEIYHPDQLRFDPLLLGSVPAAAVSSLPVPPGPQKPDRPRRHTPHGRLPIPDHLERVIINLEVPEAERLCPRTGQPMLLIGYDESEKLEYRPGRLQVNVYRRAKYASPDRVAGGEVGVLMAPLPDHPIPKCKADVGLIAHAIVSKYADHLPLYRQDGIFEREGVNLPRSTLDDWALATAEALVPLGAALKQAVLDTDVLFTDDTHLPLLERGRGKTRKARMWVYIRGAPGPPLTAYDFTLDHCKERPAGYLGPYRGYIHADAYKGYDHLFAQPGVIEVACWAHARRGFDQALSSRPLEASEILARVKDVYAWEKQWRGQPPAVRHQQRLLHVQPLLTALFERVAEMRGTALPSEPLRQAIDYLLHQQKALLRFLDDGRLEPDNNTAENAIRPLALGRKNYLFAGSERGGRATALYLGLIQSCKACAVNPWAYFDDVLRRLMSYPVQRLRELLPDQWQPVARDGHPPLPTTA